MLTSISAAENGAENTTPSDDLSTISVSTKTESITVADGEIWTVTFQNQKVPTIDVEKFVSIDAGVTWSDADSIPGPYLVFTGLNAPQFKFVVTNTIIRS